MFPDYVTNNRFPRVAVLSNRQDWNVNGGGTNNAAWASVALNTIEVDPYGIITSLVANVFTLEAGKYIFDGHCPICTSDVALCRIYNNTDAAEVGRGSCIYSRNELNYYGILTHVKTYVEITAQKGMLYQIRSNAAVPGYGQGLRHNTVGFGDNIYGQLQIIKV